MIDRFTVVDTLSSLGFPLEGAFLFLEVKSLGLFDPLLGTCSETEDASLELASEPGTGGNGFAGFNSVRDRPEFRFCTGDPACLRAGLLETLGNLALPINGAADLYGDSEVVFSPNWLVLPLKLRLPKQENLAALSAKPGSAKRAGRGGGWWFPKLGNRSFGGELRGVLIRGGHGGGGDEGGGRAANVAEFSDEFTNCQALGHGGGGRGGHHGAQGRLELGVVIKRIVPIRVHNAIRRAPAGH
nr:hypothetical protein ARALYDRAFT_487743 [Ipomoea batatas]